MAYFLLTLGAGVLLAWLYQFLIHWIPFVYLNALLSIGFGLSLGALVIIAVRQGRCRNSIMAWLFTGVMVVTSLLATYYWDRPYVVKLAGTMQGLTSEEIAQLSNLSMKDYVSLRKILGWSVMGRTGRASDLNGNVVFVVWGVEAILVISAAFFALRFLRSPYCENCQHWCDGVKGSTIRGVPENLVTSAIQQGDMNTLLSLPRVNVQDKHMVKLTYTYCTHCDKTAFLSVSHKWDYSTARNGTTTTKEKELLSNAILSHTQAEQALAGIDADNERLVKNFT